MNKNIALIYGDCSSPEIVTQAVRVLDKIAAKHGHTFSYTRAYMGGEAIDKFGDPLPAAELEKCKQSDCWVPSAVPSGRACPATVAPRRACYACARAWACTPTTARPRSGPSWRMPPR